MYSSIENELIDYQLKSWVIQSASDEAAWWYGPKTIAALREEYGNNTSTLIEEPKEDFAAYNHKWASEKYKIILEYGDLQVGPDSNTDSVSELQKLFTQLGEYNWDIDGEYNSIEQALINLQIKIGLVNNKDDWGAGYFWNQTKTALWSYYENEDSPSTENLYNLTSTEQDILDNGIGKLKSLYNQEVITALKQQIDQIINY